MRHPKVIDPNVCGSAHDAEKLPQSAAHDAEHALPQSAALDAQHALRLHAFRRLFEGASTSP